MVLTIAALDTAAKADNWILGRADLRLSFSAESATSFPSILGLCERIRSWPDGDGHGDGDGDGTKST